MLTAAERECFEETGVVRLAGAFSAAEAEAMQHVVWDELARVHSVRRDEPSSWRVRHAYGLQRITAAPAFAAIGGAPLRAAIDDLLGVGSWEMPKRWGAILVTFPRAGSAWEVPRALWHADFPFSVPAQPLAGVKMFTFVSSVAARSGGTLVVLGSHRIVERFLATSPALRQADTRRVRLALLASDPWFRDLTARDRGDDGIERFVATEARIGDVSVCVAELTGEAGDIVLTHPWVLHCRAMNCGTAPRFMRAQDIYRTSVAADLGMRS